VQALVREVCGPGECWLVGRQRPRTLTSGNLYSYSCPTFRVRSSNYRRQPLTATCSTSRRSFGGAWSSSATSRRRLAVVAAALLSAHVVSQRNLEAILLGFKRDLLGMFLLAPL
jgi:hypothetical protein